MKKFLFIPRSLSVVGLAVLFLIPFWGNAQVYHPLVDSGATWSREATECDGFSHSCEYRGGKFFLMGDTLIGSLKYNFLHFQPTYYYFYANGFPPTEYGWLFYEVPYVLAALREDSNKKVWIRSLPSLFPYGNCPFSLPLNKDTLLYDFNLLVGDSIVSAWMTSTVSEIDSIQLLNGEWRKRYMFNSGEEWIEGIGSTYGLLAPYEIYFECGSVLTCYKKFHELLYQGGSFSGILVNCDSISVGIQNINSSLLTFEISPNPASDFLSLNFSSPNFPSAQIKIIDVFGSTLLSDEIKSNQPLQIATEKFSGNCMLFCQLWEEDKLMGVEKVLIQR